MRTAERKDELRRTLRPPARCARARAARRFAVALFIAASGLHATAAEAQQFGRNKVRHHTFDFRVLRTEHFEIYYYTEAADAVAVAARMAERWHTRLTELLAHDLQGVQPLVLCT